MRHSAFVCPAASINYDLLKWISLGALESWPERLDGPMYLFEQVHHSGDSCSSDDAQRFCEHTGRRYWWEDEARRETEGHSSLSNSNCYSVCRDSVTPRPHGCVRPSGPPQTFRLTARVPAPLLLAFSRAGPSSAVSDPNLPRGLACAAPVWTPLREAENGPCGQPWEAVPYTAVPF